MTAAAAATAGLRPYQAEAHGAVTAGLRDGGRGQLLMACGTGKTRVAAAAAGTLAGEGVTVVLVPGLALAGQVIRDWQAGCPADRVLAVCSDRTIVTGDGPGGLAVPVTTDPAAIAGWLAREGGRALIVATYDSAHRLAEGLRMAGTVAELAVCDEAHRLAGPAGKITARVLGQGFLPACRLLFMTATPKVVTGTARGGELAMASMDDEALFGPVLYDYPFTRGIAEGHLKGYRIVIATVTSREVAGLLAASPDLVGKGSVPVRMAAAQAALAMAAARFRLRRCVAFLPRVDQARMFAATLPALLGMLPAGRRPPGPVSAGHVHGEMTSAQRDLALERLRRPPDGGWACVANARLLGEGVDIPAVDSVLFAAPKESPVDIIQAVGRALRPHGDAGTATVIVPALLPDAGLGGTIPDDGGQWDIVLRVVRAMCAHDQSLTAELGGMRAQIAAAPDGEPARLPARISVLAPPGTLDAALTSLRLRVVHGTTPAWHDGYGHAWAYRQRHGHLDIPDKHVTAGGFHLGTWLTAQRTRCRQGRLAAARFRLLDRLGITWDPAEATWMRSYRELAAFAEEHGHFTVPADYKTADGVLLAGWGTLQRQLARTGTLTAGRAALLEKISFPLDGRESRWARGYRSLTAAIEQRGGLRNLPAGSPEDTWLQGQLKACREGRLPADRRALLLQAGIGIPLSHAGRWAECYQALAGFKQEHGHLRVPSGCLAPGGYELRSWLDNQRAKLRAGQLNGERARLLGDLGVTPDPHGDAWQARYRELRAWKQEHGHLSLPRSNPLHDWLYQQRNNHGQGSLPVGRADLLRELGALGPPPAGQSREDPGGAP